MTYTPRYGETCFEDSEEVAHILSVAFDHQEHTEYHPCGDGYVPETLVDDVPTALQLNGEDTTVGELELRFGGSEADHLIREAMNSDPES